MTGTANALALSTYLPAWLTVSLLWIAACWILVRMRGLASNELLAFRETARVPDADGKPVQRRVNHTLAIGSLGGATMDVEWNYVQAKLMRGLGVVCIENQARI